MTKKCRYRKTGTVTVLEEYESDGENDGEDAGWYTLATLHEPGENHTGERLVWALTGLGDLRAQVARLEAAIKAKDAALGTIKGYCDERAEAGARGDWDGLAALANDALSDAGEGWLPPVQPERLAQIFHEAYERLAPEFGYKTRDASAVPWEQVPDGNKRLMIATARAALDALGGK